MRHPVLGRTHACAALAGALCLAATPVLVGCGPTSADAPSQSQEQDDARSDEGQNASQTTHDDQEGEAKASEDQRLDLLVLVNRDHALPDGWESKIELEGATNTKGDYIEVDRIAFNAFEELRRDLEKNEGITIELNSGYRSIEEQQQIWDEFMEDYGEDYVREFVAEPGHSEHHTGLALDMLLVEDGVPIVTNDDIYAREDTWETIHSHLAEHGFILRYLDGAEDITGYTYEPWHIRYVGTDAAQQIMDRGITLEEYLGEA